MPLSSHPQQPHNVTKIRAGLTANIEKMALTQSSFTNTSTTLSAYSQAQSQTTLPQPQLPPPQVFDILPALHELLARIDHASTSNPADVHDGSTDDSNDIGALYTDLQPLEPKDLPAEVLQIKAKIRRALRELEKLPDMDRSVQEQEDEIAELEAKIEKQRAMVRRFGELAKGMQGRNG